MRGVVVSFNWINLVFFFYHFLIICLTTSMMRKRSIFFCWLVNPGIEESQFAIVSSRLHCCLCANCLNSHQANCLNTHQFFIRHAPQHYLPCPGGGGEVPPAVFPGGAGSRNPSHSLSKGMVRTFRPSFPRGNCKGECPYYSLSSAVEQLRGSTPP